MNNLSRRAFSGLALASIIGGVGAAAVAAPSESGAATSTYTTSKLATISEFGGNPTTIKAKSASVLTNGNASTLVITFDRNITRSSLLAESSKVKDSNPNIILTNESNGKFTEMHFNINTSKISYLQNSGIFTNPVSTNVRYSGNTMSIDFNKSSLYVAPKDDFMVQYSYAKDGSTSRLATYYSSVVRTNGFNMTGTD